MTVFTVETRGFSNTSGRLERRHQEENFVLTRAKRVYNSFSSSSRPSPQVTEQCFQELVSESLGSFKKVQKSTFFYKALPLTLANSEHRLGVFNLSFEDYKANFLKKDDLLPSSQRDKMLENHPQEDELREFLQQEGALILHE